VKDSRLQQTCVISSVLEPVKVFLAWVVNLCKKKGITALTCAKVDPTYVFFNDYLFYNITAIRL
jgi:hypothetical protein